jgi:hypothetical protein
MSRNGLSAARDSPSGSKRSTGNTNHVSTFRRFGEKNRKTENITEQLIGRELTWLFKKVKLPDPAEGNADLMIL